MQISDRAPLSEKELFYIRDQMSWELVAAKKAYQYAHQTSDPECRNLMFTVAEQHQRNLERVMQYLQQQTQKMSAQQA
ncbi:MAG TPA: hypothetical protein VIL07_11840 [Symbiobacteriaceae bacterium]